MIPVRSPNAFSISSTSFSTLPIFNRISSSDTPDPQTATAPKNQDTCDLSSRSSSPKLVTRSLSLPYLASNKPSSLLYKLNKSGKIFSLSPESASGNNLLALLTAARKARSPFSLSKCDICQIYYRSRRNQIPKDIPYPLGGFLVSTLSSLPFFIPGKDNLGP